MLIDHHVLFYTLPPLPSLFMAVWFSFRRGLDAERTQIVGAYSLFVLVVVLCITVLTVMIPMLPWTMMEIKLSK